MRPRRITLSAAVFALGFASAAAPTPDSNNCYAPLLDLAGCPACPATQFCHRPLPGYVPTVNGCGPEFLDPLINAGVIPQGWGKADFANGGCTPPARCGCNKHDECYGTCDADKKTCDDEFRRELLRE